MRGNLEQTNNTRKTVSLFLQFHQRLSDTINLSKRYPYVTLAGTPKPAHKIAETGA
jgi:hypothetical protein